MKKDKDSIHNYQIDMWDTETNEIKVSTSVNEVFSKLVWKDMYKRRQEARIQNKQITDEHGERVSMFQKALIRSAKELKPEEIRLFNLMSGLCGFENFIHLSQREIADELFGEGKGNVSNISRPLTVLIKKQFIEVFKKNNLNFYRISPDIAWKGTFENHISSINQLKADRKLKVLKSIKKDDSND